MSPSDADGPAAPITLPISLDVRTLDVFVVGNEGAAMRVAALDERGAGRVYIFAESPPEDLAPLVGDRLIRRWPTEADFVELKPRLLFVTDLPVDHAARLRTWAHDVGAFVHVQDKVLLCDFHMPAILRRGVLQVSVSTGGEAPGLSRILRDYIGEHAVGPEWVQRVEEFGIERRALKKKGLSFQDLAQRLTDMVAARGWLKGR